MAHVVVQPIFPDSLKVQIFFYGLGTYPHLGFVASQAAVEHVALGPVGIMVRALDPKPIAEPDLNDLRTHRCIDMWAYQNASADIAAYIYTHTLCTYVFVYAPI